MPNQRDVFVRLGQYLADADYYSVRLVGSQMESLSIRHGVLNPPDASTSNGLMLTVHRGRGSAYASTSDFSDQGLKNLASMVSAWAKVSDKHSIVDFSKVEMPQAQGKYTSPVSQRWKDISYKDKLDFLQKCSEIVKKDTAIVDSSLALTFSKQRQSFLASDGTDIEQDFHFLFPSASATAHKASETQMRSFYADAYCQQGGWEIVESSRFEESLASMAADAVELTTAPNCPSGDMDVLIDPDQMILQIHESIGHPIELDRILGDERNYAGTSFVKMDMFGSYVYGSDKLNVSFDPSREHQLASYQFDDDGLRAEKTFVIKEGILLRPLGGVLSQHRAESEGVANVRATDWNRPPMDRMANLNVEPGDSSMGEMIGAVENGIYLKTNNSWSIDDSRNKFQFGCEWGRLIKNGKLGEVVKKPNYRGISANFWRNLEMVGNKDTFEVLGTPYCGKGEPNQVIRVGHATPACLFSNVSVLGGC